MAGPSVMSLVDARELAGHAHAAQRDRDGSHIAHVARVAESVPTEVAYQRVAWLHDVVEDSEITVDQLQLPKAERKAIRLLTHDEREPYQEYIERIVRAGGDAGALARSVKEADLLDNLRRCAEAHDAAVAQYGQPSRDFGPKDQGRTRTHCEGSAQPSCKTARRQLR